MPQPSQTKRGYGHKALIIALTFITALTIWLVYDSLRLAASPCEAIFQQSEMKLGVKLNVLKNEGEVLLGRQPIVRLTEKVQEVAINLKACCVMHSGKTDSRGFAQCQSRFRQFSQGLNQLEKQVVKTSEILDSGDTQRIDEAKAQTERLLDEVESFSEQISDEVNAISPPPLSLDNTTYLNEQFDGERLSEYWRVLKPDPDRWMLQPPESSLLIVTQPGSQVDDNNSLKNLFLLNQSLPESDFTIEAKIRIAIQNQKNGVSLGLWENADNYLEIGYCGFSHGYNVRRSPFFRKELRGKSHLIEEDLRQHGRVQNAETIYLRIAKKGNKYIGYYALTTSEAALTDSDWHIIATHAVPNFKGKVALWASNDDGKVYSSTNPVTPEIPVEFDYVTVK
ncbi:hypothetical protein [Alteromonas ponticola]|uniref:Beta-xylosidase C-terminal Concanavalin A-like domain-containing protein n=1 Tax=Alteromonas ponticola TaxID=2720613 RepID=A0ABX1R110_9ALTE|nr:hypothetical protein [Alteromonas ponticola]NMH59591.1 hypothetical protein [Alteromonas ponticola]